MSYATLMVPIDVDAIPTNRVAVATGADLDVAGAYGHSRLGEWFFGGFARDLALQVRFAV
jgi:nucleotide-binding universal stress UspA family protein